MLKKLYKHEFIGLYRVLLPLYGLLFALSGAVRLLSMIDVNNKVYDYINGLTVGLTGIMAVGLMFASFVLVIVNFYKSLLGKQGYLTFSLPFKAHSHIICKAVCGAVAAVTTIIAEFIALVIIFGGYDFFKELHIFFKTVFKTANDYFGTGKTTLICTEVVICALAVLLSNILMFFAAMAIGQQFKNKVLGAILSYFGIYFAIQTVMTVIMSLVPRILDGIMNSAPFAATQKYFALIFVIAAIQVIGYYLVANYFLSNKLNLE